MAHGRHSPQVEWFSPEKRGILPLEAIHVPQRLRRSLGGRRFQVRIDTAFGQVVRACAARPQTWINDDLIAFYEALHGGGGAGAGAGGEAGAHAVECWRGGVLQGGVFGVRLGAAFFAESMFSAATDAGKIALVHLAARLRAGGFRLLDVQILTPHLARFGAVEIPRNTYLQRLRQATRSAACFYSFSDDDSPARVLQSVSQTS